MTKCDCSDVQIIERKARKLLEFAVNSTDIIDFAILLAPALLLAGSSPINDVE